MKRYWLSLQLRFKAPKSDFNLGMALHKQQTENLQNAYYMPNAKAPGTFTERS